MTENNYGWKAPTGEDLKILMKPEIKILRQYAEESGTTVRSTSDLSPLEIWLLQKIKDYEKA